MANSGKGYDQPLGSEEEISISFNDSTIDERQPFLRAEQRMAKSVVLVCRQMDELRQDQFRLGPDLPDFVIGRFELLLDLVLRNQWIPYRFCEQSDSRGHGRVETGRLVHQAFARRGALYVSAEQLQRFQHLVRRPDACGLEFLLIT